jgi:hypothetical protein
LSYVPGDTVNVYLSGPAQDNATISLLDTKRNKLLSISTPIITQTIKSAKPWVDGFMYDKTFSFKIPNDFKSGIYTWMGNIPFICKSPNKAVDITVIYPSNTMNAYNSSGGKSLYVPDEGNKATIVSFLRSNIMYYEDFYQWIDKQSYSINYVADSDLDDYTEIENSKIVIITGHSEYWTRKARLNIDKFIDSGKNLLVLSGNTMWWQVRYNKDKMICYKNNIVDPLKDTIYSTDCWTAAELNYPVTSSIAADFAGGGLGRTLPGRWEGYKITNANSPLLAGTGLKNGDILPLKTTEYDGIPVVKLFALGSKEIPVIDNTKLNFYKSELLGYDFAENAVRSDELGFGTFVVAKKSETSGTVVNTASMDWCYYIIYDKFKTMTKTMIDRSLNNQTLFTN